MNWPKLADKEGYDKIGTEDAQNNYPPGWAWAGNTPLKWYKSWVHAGGVKVPFIISCPKLIKDRGGIRSQYHHVIDVNATVLELCGVTQPDKINGVRQEAKPGISMCYSFDDAGAPRRRHIQYYEMLGNRGIWADGWKAVANHVDSAGFEEDVWELYHTDEDFSESTDLAETYPEKRQELVNLWWHEAGAYGVLPMLESHFRNRDGFDFNRMLRFAPSEYRALQTFYPEMDPGGSAPRLHNKSFTITARAAYRKGDEGVLLAGGINVGGYVLYMEGGRLRFHYNYLDETRYQLDSGADIEDGVHEFAFDFVNTHPNMGIGRVLVDGRPGPAALIGTYPLFAAAGGLGIGRYATSPVQRAHKGRGYFKYTGALDWVQIALERPTGDIDIMLELERELEQA
jgi:hypothetical protein